MKKTLIALVALGSIALADTETTWTLTTGPYSGNMANAGGKGLIFQVADNERMDLTSSAPTPTPNTFVLDSINLWSRSDRGINQGCIYLTDSTNTIIAFSDLNSGAAAGYTNSATYTFSAVSNIFADQTAENHQNILTLTAGDTYKLFFLQGSAATVSGYEKSFVGNTLTTEFENDISEAVVYVTGATTGTVAQCGQLNGLNSIFSATWAPMIEVSMHSVVPEPATATLSLLALAGLAARRRRH